MFKKAFTIIELIIALIIFGFWLLVILTILNKNILLAKKVQLTTQSTLLAKEWIEIIYNIRDSNKIKYYPWDYITWDINSIRNWTYQRFQVWKYYKLRTNLTWYKNNMEEILSLDDARLYVKTWTFLNAIWETIYSGFYYNYFTWNKTPYLRYVIFTWFYLFPEWSIETVNLLKVSSIVDYKLWWITGNIILESIITDWR